MKRATFSDEPSGRSCGFLATVAARKHAARRHECRCHGHLVAPPPPALVLRHELRHHSQLNRGTRRPRASDPAPRRDPYPATKAAAAATTRPGRRQREAAPPSWRQHLRQRLVDAKEAAGLVVRADEGRSFFRSGEVARPADAPRSIASYGDDMKKPSQMTASALRGLRAYHARATAEWIRRLEPAQLTSAGHVVSHPPTGRP
jgi:hypothetical protein